MECRLAMAELRVTEAREDAARSLDKMRIQMKTREDKFSSKSCKWNADMVEAQQHVEAATQELRTSEVAEADLREKVEQLHASMREERLIRRSLRSENTGYTQKTPPSDQIIILYVISYRWRFRE
ncbi:unnamed protein product [Linum trigynum]|uniref:Uncharacterized protein n=1 Tax=Linum trigynum TaxID=586398 RepID=A0AAV2DZF3_9ROSI